MRYWPLSIIFSLIPAILAAVVYGLTQYPGISFWDSGEFIVSCYSLQVPHAPGAPLYSLMGRLMAMAGPQNPESIAWRIVFLSGIGGSVTVFFLSRWVYALAEQALRSFSNPHAFIPGMCALSGGLMATFSDTFWRNATEAEVYAPAAAFFFSGLFFTWQYYHLGNPRHLLLTCLLAGLGLCVHPTNGLLIPLLILAPTLRYLNGKGFRGLIPALLVWGILSAGLYWLISEGLPHAGVWADVVLAGESGLGFPAGSGIGAAWLGVLLLSISGTILWKNRRLEWTGLTLLLLGLTPYALIPLRSDAPMRLGPGPDAAGFYSYYTREEFGKAPVLYGPGYREGLAEARSRWVWNASQNRYAWYSAPHTDTLTEKHWFPRMHSALHKPFYQNWREEAGYLPETEPGLVEEIHFMFTGQLLPYFLRYLGWNFIGRRSDRDDSAPLAGNPFQPDTTDLIRGRVLLFALPLVLVVLGLIAWGSLSVSVWLLVAGALITGPILFVVLNMSPEQVRERDYVYQYFLLLGMATAGLAPVTLVQWMRFSSGIRIALLSACVGMVPAVQAVQGWKAHDHSGNHHALDFAGILLESCPQNSVLFTAGDNDTFPLWCAQELYGVRRDVTVLNLNLMQQPWYYRRLEHPTQAGALHFREPLPDSLDFRPTLHVEDREMEKMDRLLRSRNWLAPAMWLRYEYLLAILITQVAESEPEGVVVFSPLCPANHLLNLRPATVLDGVGRILWFNRKNEGNDQGALDFLKVCRNRKAWNPDQLNFTERTFHKLLRKKGLMHLSALPNCAARYSWLRWLDYFAPPDWKNGPSEQNIRYAQILDSCEWTPVSTPFLAQMAWAIHAGPGSSGPQSDRCLELESIERHLRERFPDFRFRPQWFPERKPFPCTTQ